MGSGDLGGLSEGIRGLRWAAGGQPNVRDKLRGAEGGWDWLARGLPGHHGRDQLKPFELLTNSRCR